MDTETDTVLHLGIYLEEYLRLHPRAKYLFTEDEDEHAPSRLKNNHRNNMRNHVLSNEEFQDLCGEICLLFTNNFVPQERYRR